MPASTKHLPLPIAHHRRERSGHQYLIPRAPNRERHWDGAGLSGLQGRCMAQRLNGNAGGEGPQVAQASQTRQFQIYENINSALLLVRVWWYNPTGMRSHREICPPTSPSAGVEESGMSPPRLVGAVSSPTTFAQSTSSSSITLLSGVFSGVWVSNKLPGLKTKSFEEACAPTPPRHPIRSS